MIRLEIETNDVKQDLVLKQDASIRMEHNSPLFKTDVIPGSRTYNITIPFNDINHNTLKHPDQIMRNGKLKVYNCNYYFWNKLISSGKLTVLRSTTEYQAQYTVNPFAFDSKKTNIADIIDEPIVFIFTLEAASVIVQQDYPVTHFQFPEIFNDKFYDGAEIENPEFENYLNKYDSDNSLFFRNTYNYTSEISENRNTLVPQPYLYHVLYKLIIGLGHQIIGDFIRDPRLIKILIYNNFPLDEFNHVDQGLNTFKNKSNLNKLLPDISVSEFINTIKDFFALGLFFDSETKKVLCLYKKTIINSTSYFDLDPYVNDEAESKFNQDNGYKLEYDFGDYDRAKLVEVDVRSDEIIEVDTYYDLFPHSGENDKVFYVRSIGSYYVSFDDPLFLLAWTRTSDKFYPVIKGEGASKFKFKLAPLLNTRGREAFEGVVPVINKEGSSDAFINGRNNPGFKLMIWHGLQPDINDNIYPFASSLNIDSKGNKIADFTLQLDGEEGIFNLYHKDWVEFISDSEPIRVISNLPIEAYFRLLDVFSAKENAPRKVRYRGINFIPEKISAMHKMHGNLVQTEIIMHKKASLEIKSTEIEIEPTPILVVPSYDLVEGSASDEGFFNIITTDRWFISFGYSSWFSIIGTTSGVGNAKIFYRVFENFTGERRHITILVASTLSNATISITQETFLF